eukprot:1354010-Amphidinium_carterae.1
MEAIHKRAELEEQAIQAEIAAAGTATRNLTADALNALPDATPQTSNDRDETGTVLDGDSPKNLEVSSCAQRLHRECVRRITCKEA